MSLDRSDVEQIAHLARLQIDAADIDGYSQSLNSILGLVDQMQATCTEGVEPLAHPLDAVQRLRRDEVTEPNQREALQAIAPATEAGLFLVPRVIE
ncbi:MULTISPECIES: Asp-tRNA(Asn)/Glu-tRNA(Gln) amidotransferase subunit GatC [Marinobacterium]|jgi:aspartyl-tRNA(Asn)/glutamyl-tRNA(Gln) amidotransferase subunit C|uniref:Aspartyl/glutamyl-tRNA(Asn/Gln) amidotransferase subunit C n=1 Tax=Marinobacterium iners DSM 11526 TaxID=1122198 RepID=A0A1H3XSI6_9GAMM|nr:Asp-tRNA(Asn)/Glu-tRNA(Gln) amidotransferase subunit GatC [Marinobacterium iners]QSR34013.1 Asp-tRNA(Asn)/Glu-tRNA(Gln) amidotransferase GatCAB subunit C [Marinobacterium iners]SEA01871.1 aspartyl/glutamyl-tRNA(Asn/Gln) amidotransferase subunit C [Marinobacterium iners DSM 11526]